MKLLISGDPHLKISTIETARRYITWFNETIESEKPDRILIMGDLFDTHSIVRVEIMDIWVNFAWKHRDRLMTLVGNHDQVSPGSDLNALVCLQGIIKWILDSSEAHGNLFFVPYVHTVDDFKNSMEPINEWRAKVDGDAFLFCHQTFQGAVYENGFYDPNGFPLELVKDFKLVISGHVHKAQRLGNVLYVGSPYHAGFADSGEKKALWLFNTDTGKMEKAILNPLPKYHVLKLSDAEAMFRSFDSASVEDHFRVIFSGGRAAIQGIEASPEFKDLKKKFKFNFVPEFTDTVHRESRISEDTSMEGMLEDYVGRILDTDLDKPRLLTLSKQLLTGDVQVK